MKNVIEVNFKQFTFKQRFIIAWEILRGRPVMFAPEGSANVMRVKDLVEDL